MSTPSFFPLTVDADGIALIHLAPGAGNSGDTIFPQALSELLALLQQLGTRAEVKGIVLHASGPNWLPAPGAQAWLELCNARSPAVIAQALAQRSRLLRAVERHSQPIAIVLEGPCLDFCLEFALACHFRVAVESEQLRFGLPLVQQGVPPSAGATQRLARLAGIAAALPWLLSGDSFDGATALGLGVISQVLPAPGALIAARAWLHAHPDAQAPWDAKGYSLPGGAGAMASHASRSFTDSVASVRKATHDTQPAPLAILSAVYEGTQLPMDLALHTEVQCAAMALFTPATRNQIRSHWLQAQARQLVRRPAELPQHPVRRLAVLGAGLMGAGIAQVAAAAGVEVVLLDTSAEHARGARDKIAAALTRSHGARAAAIMERVEVGADLQRLQGCDFVVEAVFEDRAIKADLMQRAQQILRERPDHFVWASNTSTLPISGLSGYWDAPQQVVGMHFFSPVPRMPLLEIITGQHTSSATLARAMDLAGLLGKTPIVVNDSPGFYTSRIFCAYIDEGMAMLAEGVQPALIENAARQAGFATAPLAVTDEVSLDLQDRVVRQARLDGLPARFLRTLAEPVIERMMGLQRLGRKNGSGFYDYPPTGGKSLWPELAAEFPLLCEQPASESVTARLLTIQALESARCIEEGVLTSAADGDLGALLGLGFPAWTGGTLSYIDTLGGDAFVSRCDALADRHGERFRPSDWLRARAGEPFHP